MMNAREYPVVETPDVLLAALAGTSSEEYRSLATALEKPPGTGLVY